MSTVWYKWTMNMNKVVILEGIVFAQTVLSGLTTYALGLSSSCKFPIVYNVPKIRSVKVGWQ